MPSHTAEERRKKRRILPPGSEPTPTGGFATKPKTVLVDIAGLRQKAKEERRTLPPDILEAEQFRQQFGLTEEEGRKRLLAQQLTEEQEAAAKPPVETIEEEGQTFGTDPVTGERVPVFSGGVSGVTPEDIALLAGGGLIAGLGKKLLGKASKFTITNSRKQLKNIAKDGSGLKLFGFNIGVKEMIFGSAIYSQRKLAADVADINKQATTLGTEKNEKIARWMISGLDPDLAIEIYRSDIEVLRDSDETLQSISIWFIVDYWGLKVENTQLNIQNQIEGKLSRIAEAEKFKLGLNINDIQQAINQEEVQS